MKEIKIKALNTTIYADELKATTDGKIRVYDTNKNYLDYIEEETLFRKSNDTDTNVESEYMKWIESFENARTIAELLGYFCLYENNDYEIVDDFEMGDCVNIIGDTKILFF